MLILGQVRLKKSQKSLGGLVSRRDRYPQGQSSPQELENIPPPLWVQFREGAIPMEYRFPRKKINPVYSIILNLILSHKFPPPPTNNNNRGTSIAILSRANLSLLCIENLIFFQKKPSLQQSVFPLCKYCNENFPLIIVL